ncbi:GNAT family N-acetyltransferase [Curvibacter sp. APW13]|uniref:GNAT family N-acetyltransferase n=1 Tax=Curvibacter sp. APW13 TaxID=3077236 RepID=UPI0028DDD3FE|nr:GNAT family N-acetyltransferase [Curvibacter sp. APW13]MDT8990569.1 GNAT family N-acetyltransferase [Curvibacter sp. APW13]
MSPWITEIGPLDAGHRHALQLHLMTLDKDDRYARFGRTLCDDAVLAWIRDMDWNRTQWWGAWSTADAGLLGALQLTSTSHPGVCELAFSVHPKARHFGVATAILKYVAETRTDANLKALVCENGHPAVVRMAKTLGLNSRQREEAPRLWLTLPALRI